MPNIAKKDFLDDLKKRFGNLRKLKRSQSLYQMSGLGIRIYIRYSKIHPGNRMFYGLRKEDLQQLEGHPSFICFLWNTQTDPLLIPFSDFEEIFQQVQPARDGQFKVQIFLQDNGTELYIAQAGRFNVEGYLGWDQIERTADSEGLVDLPDLSHSQIQTLLGAIGKTKGFDVWIPAYDRSKLDWSLTKRFELCEMPFGFNEIKSVLQEIDVIWLQRGSSSLRALFEVEHSTPIYSGLLRFNDIHLVVPSLKPRFSIVSNETRRSLFIRQLNRPTFRISGLNELCSFLEYSNVYSWFRRMK